MSAHLLDDRATRLFIALAAFFCVNAVLAEFIGVKIFALEDTLGIDPLAWNLFGQSGSLNFTAGTLLWPIVFVFTDVINEFYGKRGVRMISWIAVALILYGFVFAFAAIHLAPASWWVDAVKDQGVPDYQKAFAAVFGQGLWTIGGSVIAFLLGQLIDVSVFHRIRRATGERFVWLRATGSTAVSQLVDSFVVLYIAFVLGPQQWPTSLFMAVSTVNYAYKMLAAVALIPLVYLMRRAIIGYLGAARADQLRHEAAE
ncbi:queuosine precursor transporter [Lysobacter hankyongensis]|uniref:Probable queuosine precursor transporter n=1 Tax=Lysobacter hankyongensis TaxID=1176535 RepID=A0ABP9BSJ8_9GAMM